MHQHSWSLCLLPVPCDCKLISLQAFQKFRVVCLEQACMFAQFQLKRWSSGVGIMGDLRASPAVCPPPGGIFFAPRGAAGEKFDLGGENVPLVASPQAVLDSHEQSGISSSILPAAASTTSSARAQRRSASVDGEGGDEKLEETSCSWRPTSSRPMPRSLAPCPVPRADGEGGTPGRRC